HLRKLVRAGHRVAICDQVEDPRHAKGLVDRQVTRVVTPGTLTDDELLEPQANNFLVALVVGDQQCGLAWVDVSTGLFQLGDFATAQLADELGRLDPAECLVSDSLTAGEPAEVLGSRNGMAVTRRPGWSFHPAQARDVLVRQLGVATLEGFGIAADALAIG